MNFAKDGEVLRPMPAVIIFASLYAGLSWHVLTPVLALVWLHLLTYGFLEVFVRDYTVLILIEKVEKFIELVRCYHDTPMREIKLKVISDDNTLFAMVQLDKSLAHRFPLLVDFHNNLLDQILVVSLFALI